jgi:ABC-type transport system involved in cytochrome c biogenesis permease subunit
MDETTLLRAAIGCYAAALTLPRRLATWAGPALGVALALHTLSLAGRWQDHGHGPFTTLHEVLSSNLWSLALVLALAGLGWREVRAARGWAAPVLLVLAVWLLASDPRRGHFLPTYATPLLYVHAVLGKLFLGLLLVAVALAAPAWARRLRGDHTTMPGDHRRDELAYRFAAFAFVFQSLMLVAGAAWAQDAWGRYWAWDPLESWAFVTWLALVAALHTRATLRPTPCWNGLALTGVFVLAFLTFFGVPFLSTAPHKGAL